MMEAIEDRILFIEKWDPFSAKKIRALLEKKSVMVEEGNFYGEIYTDRQFRIAFDQILEREEARSRVCEAIADQVRPIKEIAKELGMKPDEVLRHVVELRRRNLVTVDHIESGKTPYYRYTSPGGSS